MIPEIEDVLNGYKDGRYTLNQCIAWVEELIKMGAESAVETMKTVPGGVAKELDRAWDRLEEHEQRLSSVEARLYGILTHQKEIE